MVRAGYGSNSYGTNASVVLSPPTRWRTFFQPVQAGGQFSDTDTRWRSELHDNETRVRDAARLTRFRISRAGYSL